MLVGTAARHFLRRTKHGCGTFELVVAETHFDEVIKYLEDESCNSMVGHEYHRHTYTKVAADSQQMLAIVHHSAQSVAAQILDLCSTTAGAVIVSWHKVYVLFPHTLFIDSEAYLLLPLVNDVTEVKFGLMGSARDTRGIDNRLGLLGADSRQRRK